jgi:dTDP-3,4-didehydro-2,6-dideoxy-alpha-D-glucose 3-reductase
MNKRVRIGILGCSRFAQRSIMPAIKSLPDQFELAGVGSRSLAKAQAVSGLFGGMPFGSYEELIAKSGLHAIYIPLPIGLHAEWIEKALKAGIHVLVEKSLAANASDSVRLCKMADAAGLVLFENFQFRFHPQFQFIVKQLNLGKIGDLRCLRASFGCPPFPDPENIRYQAHLGGGALLDMGAYTLKIAQEILGPLQVHGAVMNMNDDYGVDIWGGGFLRQEQGDCFAQVAFGFDQQYQCSLELWGSQGRIYANRIFTAPPEASPSIMVENGGRAETIEIQPANHFELMLTHFHGLIQNPRRAKSEHASNIAQSKLIEAFRRVAHA